MKSGLSLSLAVLLLAASCVPAPPPPESASPESQAPEAGPVIDMHMHTSGVSEDETLPVEVCASPLDFPPVFDPHLKPRSDFISCAEPLRSPLTGEGVLEGTLEAMERHNVVAGVTSGPLEQVRAWVEADPERIIPGLSWTRPRETIPLAQLRELLTSGQVRVLGEVTTQYRGFPPTHPDMEPVFALAEELDVPVGLHMGLGGSITGSAYTGDPAYRAVLSNPLLLEEVLVRHPGLRVYVMHAGWPMLDEMLHLLYAHPQVYVDVARINWLLPRKEFHRYLRRLVEAGFAKRILFGSDQGQWPQSIGLAIQAIESAAFLSPSQKRDIFYNNAARFLKME